MLAGDAGMYETHAGACCCVRGSYPMLSDRAAHDEHPKAVYVRKQLIWQTHGVVIVTICLQTVTCVEHNKVVQAHAQDVN
jgi:hypothetical protein